MRKNKISSFLKGRRGSVATVGGMTIGVAVAAVALSATVAHTFETRADMQRALDAALLSAARSDEYLTPQRIVEAYLQSYVKDAGISAKDMRIEAVYDDEKGVINGRVVFNVDAIFPMPSSVADRMTPRVASEVTPPGARRMEIALALDMSGSMNEPMPGGGTRLDALRDALGAMFNEIAAQETENGNNVYVSMVPYASGVNVANLRGALTPSSVRGGSIQNTRPSPHSFFGAARTRTNYMGDYYGIQRTTSGSQETLKYQSIGECLSYNGRGYCTSTLSSAAFYQRAAYLNDGLWAAEQGLTKVTQDLPPNQEKGLYFTYQDVQALRMEMRDDLRQSLGANFIHKSWVSPVMHVLPLTNDVNEMRAYARNMVAYGSTAGHLGMEWAWRTISPNWGGAWAIKPTDSSGRFQLITSILPLDVVQGILDNLALGEVGNLVTEITTGLLQGLGLTGGGGGGQSYVAPDRLPVAYDAYNVGKAIVMMTDGAFSNFQNTPYVDQFATGSVANGISAGAISACMAASAATDATGVVKTRVEKACRASFSYFEQVCTAAKARGIKVYTIAFTDGAAGSLDSMSRCASDPDQAFAVDTGVQLKSAFTRIFRDTSSMYVSR
ncbi:hypothetical protein [Neomegalonema sp.]|uniref:hypothetical protein n=1 Tax=Neomegalonema sp. TaxID=2039713 RepID=UPI00263949F2|nr:hypothetical protein [Neomegalonema sp.]MDD2869182.1 hypothetical protein [Neomegalonema sp.]